MKIFSDSFTTKEKVSVISYLAIGFSAWVAILYSAYCYFNQ